MYLQFQHTYSFSALTVSMYLQYLCTYSVSVLTVSVYLQYLCTDSVSVLTVSLYLQCQCTYSVLVHGDHVDFIGHLLQHVIERDENRVTDSLLPVRLGQET